MINTDNCIPIASIPRFSSDELHTRICTQLRNQNKRCLTYCAVPKNFGYLLICAIADDETQSIDVAASELHSKTMPSITAEHHAMHAFEREMYENFGIQFTGHPWLKPLRYPADRFEALPIKSLPANRLSDPHIKHRLFLKKVAARRA